MPKPVRGPGSGPGDATKTATKERTKSLQLPPYKVILHNDDFNEMKYVVQTIMELIHLTQKEAEQRMWEAHTTGAAMLLITHRERAELIAEQFASKRLTASIEPA